MAVRGSQAPTSDGKISRSYRKLLINLILCRDKIYFAPPPPLPPYHRPRGAVSTADRSKQMKQGDETCCHSPGGSASARVK